MEYKHYWNSNKVFANSETYVIAEIGINHNGIMDTAYELINKSMESGVHGVKFQYRNLERSYGHDALEIGDEILMSEIERTFLNSRQYIELTKYAKTKNLLTGISFFNSEDINDFEENILLFDFFKIPSVELTNIDLINLLLSYEKPVLISLGAHDEKEIEKTLNNLVGGNWIPMHCISNYPLALHNSNFGYMRYLNEKWKRPIGYSSHDVNWFSILLTLQFSPIIIERHITLAKTDKGLDHSSSSTPEEFINLIEVINSYEQVLKGYGPRNPNQGERINRQNLGRGLYSKIDIQQGETLDFNDFEYRVPQIGLDISSAKAHSNRKFTKPIKSGQALTLSHFEIEPHLNKSDLETINNYSIGIPVRLHDFKTITKEIPLRNYELHLSFKEIEKLNSYEIPSGDYNLSIHLPDYISSTQLINPLSSNEQIKNRSHEILNKVANFAHQISQKKNSKTLITGSFSDIKNQLKTEYLFGISELFSTLNHNYEIKMSAQWLPPIAWYFGGSVKLNIFNSLSDAELVSNIGIDICMDTSHLILCKNFSGFDSKTVMEILKKNILYFHLSDAIGIDGEGFPIDLERTENLPFLLETIKDSRIKIYEVWQGHLDGFRNFKVSLKNLASIINTYA